MAGKNNKKGRGSGGVQAAGTAPKARLSPEAFDRRIQRANNDAAFVRRAAVTDFAFKGPNAVANKRRELQTQATAAKARSFYAGLGTDRATGMPTSPVTGFRNRERSSTGSRRNRLVGAEYRQTRRQIKSTYNL